MNEHNPITLSQPGEAAKQLPDPALYNEGDIVIVFVPRVVVKVDPQADGKDPDADLSALSVRQLVVWLSKHGATLSQEQLKFAVRIVYHESKEDKSDRVETDVNGMKVSIYRQFLSPLWDEAVRRARSASSATTEEER